MLDFLFSLFHLVVLIFLLIIDGIVDRMDFSRHVIALYIPLTFLIWRVYIHRGTHIYIQWDGDLTDHLYYSEIKSISMHLIT